MIIACWSVKGGSGTTVVTACLGVVAPRAAGRDTLVVDLDGDLPAALGLDQPRSPGVVDWLAAAHSVARPGVGSWTSVPMAPAEAGTAGDLDAFEVTVDESVSLLPRGAGDLDIPGEAAAELLARRLGADGRLVVVDAGTRPVVESTGVADRLIAASDRSLLVVRPCYLALRQVAASPRRIDGVVLVEEPGRALGADDVASVTGAPVVARLRCEPQVARVVDAGLLRSRIPRTAEAALAAVVAP